MEPLQKRLDALRERGQDLIEAAGSGVNTGTLDAELESLNDKWAHLNERVCGPRYQVVLLFFIFLTTSCRLIRN